MANMRIFLSKPEKKLLKIGMAWIKENSKRKKVEKPLKIFMIELKNFYKNKSLKSI